MEVSIDWQRAQDGWSRNWMAVNWAKPKYGTDKLEIWPTHMGAI